MRLDCRYIQEKLDSLLQYYLQLFLTLNYVKLHHHQEFYELLLGAPGSGKGTISNWIVRDFGLKHVSSGDILRQHIKDGTDLGREAKNFIDKGALVPDEVMVNLISSELKKLESEPWLLDGNFLYIN